MDFWVVRCGLPRDLVARYQAVRKFWVGECGLSLISFPTNVSCRFKICCLTIFTLLNSCLTCAFFMWSVLTSSHEICNMRRILVWWNASSSESEDLGEGPGFASPEEEVKQDGHVN